MIDSRLQANLDDFYITLTQDSEQIFQSQLCFYLINTPPSYPSLYIWIQAYLPSPSPLILSLHLDTGLPPIPLPPYPFPSTFGYRLPEVSDQPVQVFTVAIQSFL